MLTSYTMAGSKRMPGRLDDRGGIENGIRNPTVTVLKKLADALGVPPAALLE